ncbi:phosphatase PAP2 family protein [Streptomyces gamaensis]|uniref:Phosphatase PAP2 family protein n=1 Tax=Streptomyces gamaensis TaxID=1763542 RepID=A0ABW0Z247_9ACTN
MRTPLRPRVGLPALSGLAFAALTWQISVHGPLRTADERLGRTAVTDGVPGLPPGVAQFLADLGNATVAVPVLVLAALWALWRPCHAPRWHAPLAAALAMAAVPALVVPLKLWIARPGPPPMAGVPAGFFPSGHAATAAVAYGAAALLLAYGRPSGRLRAVVAAGCAVVNIGVGAGLVRRGYHWPLDVLGSWCLAGVLLWAVARVLTRARAPRGPRPPRASTTPAAPGR